MAPRYSKYSSDSRIKEDFCPACVAIPLAMAGAGTGWYASEAFQKKKGMIICGSCIFTVVMVAIAIYCLSSKTCKSCR
jgi:hypothetical protein